MESPDGLYLERCERNILSYESAILNTCLLVFLRLSPVPNLIHIVTRRSGACITPLSVINDVFFFTLYLGVVIISKGQSSAIECVGLSTAWGRHPPRELVGWQAFCALIEIPQIGVLWLTAIG
jgi:hypothetical protein